MERNTGMLGHRRGDCYTRSGAFGAIPFAAPPGPVWPRNIIADSSMDDFVTPPRLLSERRATGSGLPWLLTLLSCLIVFLLLPWFVERLFYAMTSVASGPKSNRPASSCRRRP